MMYELVLVVVIGNVIPGKDYFANNIFLRIWVKQDEDISLITH